MTSLTEVVSLRISVPAFTMDKYTNPARRTKATVKNGKHDFAYSFKVIYTITLKISFRIVLQNARYYVYSIKALVCSSSAPKSQT